MTEAEFINGLKNRDEKVFELFVNKHHERVVRTCYGFLHDVEDAEDVAQDVFIEVLKSIGNFKGTASLSTWLYRISVNKSLNYLRDKKKRRNWLSINRIFPFGLHDNNIDIPVQENSYEEKEYRAYQKKIIFKAIDSLPDKQRTAFVLNKYEDLSYKEVAETMQLSLQAVESLIFRARESLRKKLEGNIKKTV